VPLPAHPFRRKGVPPAAGAAFADARVDVDRFFDLSLDVMGIANAEGHFVRVNPAFERTLGYSLAEFAGRPFIEFVHPDDVGATQAKFAALGSGDSVLGFENRYRCKDGTFRWLLWTATSMQDGHTYAVARDITARREMEQELLASREQALEASRTKWAFVAGMSHELRTPLNGLIGMIELLRATPLDAAQAGYVDAQDASAQELLAVVGNVLHFSMLEAGPVELECTNFELRHAIWETCQMLANQAHSKGLEIVRLIGAQVPLAVVGDRARLSQILLNLLSTAVRFTTSGEITVRVSRHENDQIRFSISDSGTGIDAEQATTLFEAFSHADQSTIRRHGATGLGLAISRQLVELMGGQIGATPRAGGGSLFWFSVELREADRAFASVPARGRNPSTKSVPADRPPLVLLAEDNEINCVVAEALLAKLGLQAAVAINGREAIEMAECNDYGAIFMDCLMPEVDGLQATRQIRAAERDSHVPIIAMTALAMPGDRERCLAAGMDDYLTKPVRLDALAAVVHRWLPDAEAIVP
jgi:PAS domain S-box-containing protein